MKFIVTDKLFSNLKNAEKELITEIVFNKQYGHPNEQDIDFGSVGNNSDVDLDDVADVFNNKIIQSASNIKVYAEPTKNSDTDMIVLKHNNGKEPAMSKSLDVTEVLSAVKGLLKLGKAGVAERAEENQKTRKHISALETQMDI